MQKPWLLLAIALVSTTGTVFGVTMQLMAPPPGPQMAGVYTSPYKATVDGVPTLIICDDFLGDVSLNTPPWQATVTSVASLPSATLVKFDTGFPAQQLLDYGAAAYLAQEILTTDQSTPAGQYTAGVLSYALWDVFDPALLTTYQNNCSAAFGCLSAQQLFDANAAITAARTNTNAGSYSQYTNVDIYMPSSGSGIQEFIGFAPSGVVATVPEPSAPALLAFYLSGLVGLIFIFRRRVVRAAS